jgi:hypothetical protein
LLLVEIVGVGTITSLSVPPACAGTGCPTLLSARTAVEVGASSSVAVGEYYGIISGPGTDTISVTFVSDLPTFILVAAFKGVLTSSPFAPSVASAAGPGSTASTLPSTTISTTLNEIAIVGMEGDPGTSAETAGTGFSLIKTATATGGTAALEYETTTSALCSPSCTINFGTMATNWNIIGDAVTSTTSVPDLPEGIFLIAVPIIVLYLILRRRQTTEVERITSKLRRVPTLE